MPDQPEVCPQCGGTTITYGDYTMDEKLLLYKATCDDCGCQFEETYSITYNNSIIRKEDNNE